MLVGGGGIGCSGGGVTTVDPSTNSSGEGSTTGSTGAATESTDATGSTEDTTGASDGSSTSTGTQEVCELGVDLEVLHRYLDDLQEVSDALAAASDLKPAGFLAAPGYSEALMINLAQPLEEPCAEASALDPVCEEDRCWQVSCTGEGAKWTVSSWVDLFPAQAGDYTFSELSVTVSSGEQGIFDFQIASFATKGPERWGIAGNGAIVGGGFDTVTLLADLVEDHESVLIAVSDDGTFSGSLEVDNIAVAEINADGTLTATGACY